MLTRRLTAADRAPSAVPVGIGYVEGRRLTFHKIGVDGSGKCDAEATGDPSDRAHRADRVWGVLFDVELSDKANLDRAESLGTGYVEETVRVRTPHGDLDATTYVAVLKDPALRPFDWYKALVAAGAEEHGLPAEYVARLRATPTMPDPRPHRRARNEALLDRSPDVQGEA